ncbi:MAG: glutathione S-transferase family protein, partial [Myxococcales bacterium]|nr:glutathione S-transferase family protein [Myxococcales bacterium]
EPIERVETATEAGQRTLREVTPIRKVPTAEVDGRVIFDSRAIIERLLEKHGWKNLAAPRDRWRTLNLLNAIDGALDGIVQVFYLRRDGVAIDGTPFAERQIGRADAVFKWLGAELADDKCSFDGGLGLAELALITTLDWMDFRGAYPTDRAPELAPLRAKWKGHPSLAATMPTDTPSP